MIYLLLIINAFISESPNIFIKLLQDRIQNDGIRKSVYYTVTIVVALTYYAIISGFNLKINLITIAFSAILAADSYFSMHFQLKAVENTDLVNVALFSNAGSIIWPVVFGFVFLDEKIDFKTVLGFILVFISVFIPYMKGRKERGTLKGIIYCVILFITMGSFTIIIKLYSLTPTVLSESVMCFYTNVFMIPMTLILIRKQMPLKQAFQTIAVMPKKNIFPAVLAVICSNTATILSMIIVGQMKISEYSILKTSIGIVAISILAWLIFEERITLTRVVCIALSVSAIVLIV